MFSITSAKRRDDRRSAHCRHHWGLVSEEKVVAKRLQLALDVPDLKFAQELVRRVGAHADILEVGTPLIKKAGVNAISVIKRLANRRPVIADMKTMDNAAIECALAFGAGADGIIVQAAAARETVEISYAACTEKNKTCYIDSLGLSAARFLEIIKNFAGAVPVLHVGVDAQSRGGFAESFVSEIAALGYPAHFAVAGGIHSGNVSALLPHDFLSTYIVGAGIAKSPRPGAEARALSHVLKGTKK